MAERLAIQGANPWIMGESMSGIDFQRQSVRALVDAVRRRELAARELVAHALDRIERIDRSLGAFVALDGDRALDDAARIDEAVAAGRDPGPLAGIPIGVKDLEDAAGFPTTFGSAALTPAVATADSVQVARLRAAGCVVVGKTNTPELGYKADTVNARFGPTANPWDPSRSPGGSSGGSAAAVAAGLVPLATGSDGGGSIRIPSACCGLSGVKPSLGRVPSGGGRPPEWLELSTAGPIARRIADIAAALDVVVAPDPTDLRSLPRPEASWPQAVVDASLPSRVAWSPTLGYAPVDAEVRAACQRAVDAIAADGVDVVEVDTVFDEDPVDAWLAITSACELRTLAHLRGTEAWGRVDPLLAAQAEWASTLSVVDLVEALDVGHRLNLRLVALFHRVDLLLTPTCAALAPPRRLDGQGEINGSSDPNWVRFTYPFNLTRSPAATVSVGLGPSGVPIGLQLVGPQHGDLVVLRAAAALEELIGFDQHPAGVEA
jgi:Asp-tRNA(Asn)/Glu-tRNA(Gln) amidotransferase A subunit family amidase